MIVRNNLLYVVALFQSSRCPVEKLLIPDMHEMMPIVFSKNSLCEDCQNHLVNDADRGFAEGGAQTSSRAAYLLYLYSS